MVMSGSKAQANHRHRGENGKGSGIRDGRLGGAPGLHRRLEEIAGAGCGFSITGLKPRRGRDRRDSRMVEELGGQRA
jgi:hypothetical protein